MGTTCALMLSALLTLTAKKPSQTTTVDSSQPSASPTAPQPRAESTVFLNAELSSADEKATAMPLFPKFAMDLTTHAKRFSAEATLSAAIDSFAKTTFVLIKSAPKTATATLTTTKFARTISAS